jgi:hypothetical protein
MEISLKYCYLNFKKQVFILNYCLLQEIKPYFFHRLHFNKNSSTLRYLINPYNQEIILSSPIIKDHR